MFSLPCVHVRNWEITNFNLIPRGFSATFRLRAKARIFSSFQLLSIVLTYKVNWLFHFSQPVLPNLHRGTIKNLKKKSESDRKFFGLTRTQDHAKIATGNIHTKYCTVRSSQGWPNFFTERMERGLISALSWKRKDCRLRRCLNFPQKFEKWYA